MHEAADLQHASSAHPPARVPSRAEARVLPWMFSWGRARAGLTVAAKAGADAPGGGISLCFCRRGCAAPALKAATLNILTAAPAPKAATLNTTAWRLQILAIICKFAGLWI